ncbi:hypothetical protein B1992_12030 [Pseudoxanthomonas broegbernensis]|uniref:TIGR02001 family outer membrane protein n=1 Tax=Pseudoxanthomonas broegbernensis TaxID=83619 RepID=A0A7V8GL49_9GAMM|nr:TorF family putative porin [Pseudoxanthomonas broegbernensis]KAF1685466.1 hypothetical protein B1992_12030 [Pseudoxanthomonas broegbernensis]MBB6064403.1 uncharacterized protein (TIGR02001 family) [Pseudoxanthomonas broegbernensis]
MKPFKLAALAIALLALPFASLAQEADEAASPLTWSVAAVSDYVWRGASQSDENPTAQAGLTYTSSSGVYAGVWGSGVDFGPGDPDLEVDYFVGYNVDLSESVNFDVLLNRYSYPGAADLNFNELAATAAFAETYRLTVAYSNDFGGSDTDAWYFAGGASWGLPNDFSLDAGVGYSKFDSAYSDNYVDWNIGVSKSWGLFTAALGYHGVDGNGRDIFGDLADDRLVLTLSLGN